MSDERHDTGSTQGTRDAQVAQIAIDGAAGVGKSTVGERVAQRLGYLYIDSGAFYRALTLLALRQGVAPDDEAALLALIEAEPIHITRPVVADGRQYSVFAGDAVRDASNDLAPSLHSLDVTRTVSVVAGIPSVRKALIARMRAMANAHSVVMVGRDIGLVVLPDATLKIALRAPADERARRRHADLVAALGDDAPAYAQVLADIEARDRKDAVNMELAPDAVPIENRDGQLDIVVDRICALLAERLPATSATPAPAREVEPADAPAVPEAAQATQAAEPPAESPAPSGRRPRATTREGAYVAPPVKARNVRNWDGTSHPFGYEIVRTVARLAFPFLFKLRVEGLENVPATGPVVLASNHVAWIDIPLVAYPIKRITHYMAKIELFSVFFLGWVIGITGAFPVRRGEGDRESLRTAERLLREGELIAIFPEGHRTGGSLIRALPGVALIALRADAPVAPVAIINSMEVFKKGHIVIRRPTVTVRYGKPFRLTTSSARYTRQDMERGSDEIMLHIAELLPPEYRGVYAQAQLPADSAGGPSGATSDALPAPLASAPDGRRSASL